MKSLSNYDFGHFIHTTRGEKVILDVDLATEHGAVMAATILKSERAIQISVFVVRAFIKMRLALHDSAALAAKLARLEKEIRLDSHEKAIVELMQQFFSILNPQSTDGSKPEEKREIGFHVKDKGGSDSKLKRAR